jgi:hypothetical protein
MATSLILVLSYTYTIKRPSLSQEADTAVAQKKEKLKCLIYEN